MCGGRGGRREEGEEGEEGGEDTSCDMHGDYQISIQLCGICTSCVYVHVVHSPIFR